MYMYVKHDYAAMPSLSQFHANAIRSAYVLLAGVDVDPMRMRMQNWNLFLSHVVASVISSIRETLNRVHQFGHLGIWPMSTNGAPFGNWFPFQRCQFRFRFRCRVPSVERREVLEQVGRTHVHIGLMAMPNVQRCTAKCFGCHSAGECFECGGRAHSHIIQAGSQSVRPSVCQSL